MDNIIVYGLTKERAYDKLHQLLDNMKYGDIAEVKKSKYEFIVILKNGDVYKAVSGNDSTRGVKWQYAYVDKTINDEVFDNIILPSFIPKLINGIYDTSIKREDRILWY